MLDALEEVHEQGIWHLDLKPGNIMVGTDGVAKLIDFGASKQMSASEGYTTTSTALCYTPGYAPTEQIDQKMDLIGPWTDLYALGATLYKLLTDKEPPTVSDMQEDNAFVYPASVSGKTRHLIQWMMTPRRQLRPQSVAEVRDFLKKPFTEPDAERSENTVYTPKEPTPKPSKPKPAPKPEPGGKMKWIAAAVAAVVVVTGLFFILKLKGNSGDKVNEIVEQVKEIAPETKTVTDRYFKSALGVCSYTGQVDDDGNPHGKGEASFTDGRLYRGLFEHGAMTGDNAYFRYENGDTFEGSFINNAFNRGRYTMKDDGSYFEGTFKNGQPDQGQWYDRKGNRLE